MTRPVEIDEIAREEFLGALRRYLDEDPALGERFRNAVDEAMARLLPTEQHSPLRSTRGLTALVD